MTFANNNQQQAEACLCGRRHVDDGSRIKREILTETKAESQHNQSMIAMFNSSLTYDDAKSSQNPVAAVAPNADDNEEEKKELHFDYDDDIVNQNSSLEISAHSRQSHHVHHRARCQCGAKRKQSHIENMTRKQEVNYEKTGPARFTYFSSASLSDDRWVCPICLDIFTDAVETPCCNNLFCERCIL